jgi:lipopolysaccharide transport system ATP-binding protein
MPAAIALDAVSMKFTLHHQRARSFQEALVNLVHRRNVVGDEDFWALRDVNFDVQPGETLGIIGPNGSGKSTLLKLITRILDPTSGKVTVNGRVSALIELGAGFHPDLTGRENIYLNGSILGFSRKQMNRRFDQIVAFSELERFIDTPVKHYSSGMYARLGFAVAISVDPDILIIDEVLSVGDEAFQHKCLERIDEFRRRGKTIIFVSHAMGSVERLCDRVVWLQNGVVRGQGPAVATIRRYEVAVREHEEAARRAEQSDNVDGATDLGRLNGAGRGAVEIRDTRTQSLDGRDQFSFQTGDPVVLRVRYRPVNATASFRYGLTIRRSDGLLIHQSTTTRSAREDEVDGADRIGSAIIPSLALLPGTYDLIASIVEDTRDEPSSFDETGGCRISVWSDGFETGLVSMIYGWQAGRRSTAASEPVATSV